MTASEIVVSAMAQAIAAIIVRVIRAVASRPAPAESGAVTGSGASAGEDDADVRASVIGHLRDQVRCYSLRR
ncbi:hypothetical protein [Amycolatopsis sp. NPDC051903]|uniref:hypothetical protein n=1 Tax=Amycolatopsis sp. NPDC051903 TaxID=3363936 RepID=UPI0037955A64